MHRGKEMIRMAATSALDFFDLLIEAHDMSDCSVVIAGRGRDIADDGGLSVDIRSKDYSN